MDFLVVFDNPTFDWNERRLFSSGSYYNIDAATDSVGAYTWERQTDIIFKQLETEQDPNKFISNDPTFEGQQPMQIFRWVYPK